MFRTSAFIFVLAVCFSVFGCSSLPYLDGTSEEEMKLFNMDKKEIYGELKKSELENERLQKQIDIGSEQNRSLQLEAEALRTENQRISRENAALQEQLSEIQKNIVPTAVPDSKDEKGIERLRIKVLSGNGDLSSAKSVAKKLRGMGYSVQMIDYAPRSNFDSTTIYFAPNREDEAGHLMFNMGGSPLLKPLSWPTTFDIIVVTGPDK